MSRYPGCGASGELQRYLREDILAMAKIIKQFRADIRTDKPGAEKAYWNFKVQRKEHVLQLACVCSSLPVYSALSEWEVSTMKHVIVELLVYIFRCMRNRRKLSGMLENGMSTSEVFISL